MSELHFSADLVTTVADRSQHSTDCSFTARPVQSLTAPTPADSSTDAGTERPLTASHHSISLFTNLPGLSDGATVPFRNDWIFFVPQYSELLSYAVLLPIIGDCLGT